MTLCNSSIMYALEFSLFPRKGNVHNLNINKKQVYLKIIDERYLCYVLIQVLYSNNV